MRGREDGGGGDERMEVRGWRMRGRGDERTEDERTRG